MQPEQPIDDYLKPVAYDAEGQPLYAHPAAIVQSTIPQTTVAHPDATDEPNQVTINLDVKARHDKSVANFPMLNLDDQDYIVNAVRRHPIGLFIPLATGVLLVAIALSVLFNYDIIVKSMNLTGVMANVPVVAVAILIFSLLISFGVYVAYYIYENNKLFLTNESIIQEIQTSLFSHQEQTVSLINIENVSYEQVGIIQQLFDYGSIKLSVENDDVVYQLTYVSHPKKCTAVFENTVESFKNGRSVSNN